MDFYAALGIVVIALSLYWLIREQVKNSNAVGPMLDAIISGLSPDDLLSVSYKGRSTNFQAHYRTMLVERLLVPKGEYYEQVNFVFFINEQEVVIVCSETTPMIIRINKTVYHAPHGGFQNRAKIDNILKQVNTII